MFQILVVEDDKDLNRTVCSFLNQSGYESTGCFNAEEAYEAMYNKMFDLIVSDIMMPGTDGFEFARMVRSLNEDIPILFMTARDDFASKQRGYRIGIDDYMVKPIDLDELFLRIGALLRRSKIASSRRLETGDFMMDADTPSGPRTVDVYMTKLRSKLSKCESFEIVTVHGLGYKAVLK